MTVAFLPVAADSPIDEDGPADPSRSWAWRDIEAGGETFYPEPYGLADCGAAVAQLEARGPIAVEDVDREDERHFDDGPIDTAESYEAFRRLALRIGLRL